MAQFRVFYWFGAYYSTSLLAQAVLMIIVQSILLKVALDHRAPAGAKGAVEHAPFSDYSTGGTLHAILSGRRPYDFWRWSSARP
jgi:hypothetical protein